MGESTLMKCDECGIELHGKPLTASLPYTEAPSGALRVQIFRFCLKHGPEIPADEEQLRQYLVGLLIRKNPWLSVMTEKQE